MDKFKKVKVIGNVIGFNIDASGKETYNVQFPDMTVAELESYQFEDADAYHTNGKPLCLRNVLARLRGLPEHDREVWLKGIMDEFKSDFSHAKWREGYAQGKFDGAIEREKVVLPQFVAEWIERSKAEKRNLRNALNNGGEKMRLWFLGQENYDIFARAWLCGYEVEKEKTYTARLNLVTQNKEGYLNKKSEDDSFFIDDLRTCSGDYQTSFTRSELEGLDIWDNPVFEIKEVE